MRRIVCGPGEDGPDGVLFHDEPRVVIPRAGQQSTDPPRQRVLLAWATPEVDSGTNDLIGGFDDFDFKLSPGEVRFLRVEISPGASAPMHRTPHINEFLVAISGRLTLFTEDGAATEFAAGDMLVQLAGWHSWRNESDEPFVMAGTIIGIKTEQDAPRGVQISDAP
jgi:quercetin dioxygenase-like cupin family protein